MRFLTRSLTGLFLLAITLGFLAAGFAALKSAIEIRTASSMAGRPSAERSFSARVARLEPQRIAPSLTAYGEVQSRRTLELRAPAAGEVVELAPGLADGARVTAGQLLVRTDPADAQSAVALARAGLTNAEAEVRDAAYALELAQADLKVAEEQVTLRQGAYDRQKGIGERGFGTATDIETAELALSTANQSLVARRQSLAQAQARVDQSKTALEMQKLTLAEAERRLSETELRAGFAGVLTGVTVVAGGLVAKSEKLGELVDPNDLEVSFRVSTEQYSHLADAEGRLAALPVIVELETSSGHFGATGTLSRVDATVGAGVSGRLLFATLKDPVGLKPGDFVTVTVAEAPIDGVALLPAVAVGPDGTLLLVGAENRLEAAPAEIVRRQGDAVIVRVGDLAGREVIIDHSPLLGAGILVRPVRGDEKSEAPAAGRDSTMIDLTPERRAALISFVEGSGQMGPDAKERLLAQLREDRVPAATVQRIEARMGG